MSHDAQHMARALALAGLARGRTSPNPLVGAVVVAPSGVIVGSGYHQRAGEPHAEVHALREAGPKAKGATLFCTLEPCAHHGRTPPCAHRIVEAGVARVVAAVEDPNPLVAGRGFAHLRQHGVTVDVGERRGEAERLNRPFFTAMRLGRPWVIAKIALSVEAAVATAGGGRVPLSSAPANRLSQSLRAEVDAIAVGSGTVLTDDPALTCREVFRARPLVRVIFDRRLRTPPGARIWRTLAEGPVLVVTDPPHAETESARLRTLESVGAEVVSVPDGTPAGVLRHLGGRGLRSLLLEGGVALHRSALAAQVVDRVRVIVTPRVLGPGGVPWISAGEMSLPALSDVTVDQVGPDVIIEGDVHRTH